MGCEVRNTRRTWLIALLLCLTFLGQSADLLAAIEPHTSTEHCCLLCHVGSLPFLETEIPLPAAPIVVVDRLVMPPDVQASHDVLLNSHSSRAPPAASPIA
ncbi:MAG TPA: hypothetical protein VGL72_25435 [Bryobacteraceae bacterium]|jgi:hypothetical protein